MIKYGPAVFQLLPKSEHNAIFEELELQVPSQYKTFMSLYKAGLGSLDIDLYKDEAGDVESIQMLSFSHDSVDNDDLGFEYFDTIADVINNHKNKLGYEEEEIESGYLRIASSVLGGGIFLGIHGESRESVFMCIWDDPNGMVKLANDIWEFSSCLSLVVTDDAKKIIESGKLVKKWGDPYWELK